MLTLTYRPTPDAPSVTLQLADDRWDELHDRLVAQGMCSATDARLDAIIRRQRVELANLGLRNKAKA